MMQTLDELIKPCCHYCGVALPRWVWARTYHETRCRERLTKAEWLEAERRRG